MNRIEQERPEERGGPPPPAAGNRSLGELFSDLTRESFSLLRHEVELAKSEVAQKIQKASKATISLMVGAAVVFAGFLSVLAAAVIGLMRFMPPGVAALLVGLAAMGVGGIVVLVSRKRLQKEELVPHNTVEVLKGEKEWIKDRMS